MLKSTVYPTILPTIDRKRDSGFFYGHWHEVNYKQLHPGFELESISYNNNVMLHIRQFRHQSIDFKNMSTCPGLFSA